MIVENGTFTTTFSVPESSGKIFDAELEVWDPIEYDRFLRKNSPTSSSMVMHLCCSHQLFNQISRFDLGQVDIGANIEEPQSWTKGLAMTCQVRSTTIEWEPITLVREPMDVFDGRTLFSFRFNFSESGQPSLLGSQASLDCWASGTDDAGWVLFRKAQILQNHRGHRSLSLPQVLICRFQRSVLTMNSSPIRKSLQLFKCSILENAFKMRSM